MSQSESTPNTVANTRNILAVLSSPLQGSLGSLPDHTRPFPFINQAFKTLLFAFIIVDLAFIGLNALAIAAHSLGLIDAVPELLKITKDLALPEDFNYLKWAIIVLALMWLSVRDHWLPPLIWAFVFVMILADDSMQLHEKLGSFISSWSELPSSTYFYGDDLGELLAFVAMGLVAFVLTIALFVRGGVAAKAITLRYGLVIVALGAFGVGVDAVHQVVSHLAEGTAVATILSQLFGVLEEGGEMIVASFTVAMTLAGEFGPQPGDDDLI